MLANNPPMPPSIARLPRDHRDFPVPWFVVWFKDGKPCAHGEGAPDFRVVDPAKLAVAVRQHRCWVCGEQLGVFKTFTIGPMCSINRIISEPPSHRDCAIYSARACPFLSRPRMRRNEKDLPTEHTTDAAGFHIKRNPGAVCVWITKSFRPFRPDPGAPGILFSLGDPIETFWFAEGREASRAEVMASIESGYPALLDLAQQQGPSAVAELERARNAAMTLVPAA